MKTFYTIVLFSIYALISFGQNNSIQPVKKEKGGVYFRLPPNVTSDDYTPKTIIFKVKPEYRNVCDNSRISHFSFNKISNELDIISMRKKYPNKKAPERATNERGEKLVDLSLIYKLSYNSEMDIEKAINHLYSSGIIEYAEPQYIPKLYYTVNDPENGVVYALSKMKVFDAWNITTGDTNVVIGITDTGIDYTHPDLKGNIKYNYNDTINGIDDDNDGYIDNFRGWDLGQDDNDATYIGDSHGVHVSGTAAASTDNSIGISGVGFNCKFLPVKIADGSGALTASYDGIVYAADQGCHIINCSWGGAGGGQFGQDIINYATINKNSLVVCGAGNDNVQDPFYPASFNNALSVASTGSTDVKSGFSNYGYHVDISAPGQNIYSTLPGNTYGNQSGTSMAAPNAAGAAAIVKSRFPSYTALQIGEQLRVTADKIDQLNSNSYRDKLGGGRINLYKAVTDTISPSVIFSERILSDHNDNAFYIGDTIYISGNFINYLAPANNLSATLTASSSYVNIIDGTTTLGAIPTLGTVNNHSDPFKAVIKPNTPSSLVVNFKLTLNDGFYSSKIYFEVTLNVDYINIAINDVATSITSIGRIGYTKESQLNGLGFKYKGGNSLLYEGGLMIGNSGNAVSNTVRGASTTDNHFASYETVKRILPGVSSEFDAKGGFNDSKSDAPLNLLVNHSAFAWSSTPDRKYIIVVYHIKNNGSTSLNDLYAGIFTDWDIMDYKINRADFDAANKMGYSWSTESGGLYGGIKVLSATAPVNYYAIDNVTGGDGGIDISDGFDDQEKYTSLSTSRLQAGINANGIDVISVISSGPYDLLPGDSAIVAFALLAGDSLEDMQSSAVAAQSKYDTEILPLNVTSLSPAEKLLIRVYPNPAKDKISLEFNLQESAMVQLNIYNALGEEVEVGLNNTLEKGKHNLNVDVSNFENGIYFYKLTAGEHSFNGKMNVLGL